MTNPEVRYIDNQWVLYTPHSCPHCLCEHTVSATIPEWWVMALVSEVMNLGRG